MLSSYNNSATLSNLQTSLIRPQALNQLPSVTMSANPRSGSAPLTVRFTSNGTDPDGTIVSYAWNFGDGATSAEQNPTHTYASAGSYSVSVTVADNSHAISFAGVLISVQPGAAIGIPKLMRFQAKLADAQGAARTGTFKVTFKLYDVVSGGTPLWQEVQNSLAVSDGVLDAELGSVTSLDLPFDKQYWLGVEVASYGEMSPRFKLTTAPYSFSSKAIR